MAVARSARYMCPTPESEEPVISWLILLLSIAGFIIHRLLGEAHRRAMVRILRPAVALGLAGLFAGLLLPVIVPPDASRAPLLAMLVSGPTWFAAGLLLGIARELLRKEPTP
jgi:hypothetical protein